MARDRKECGTESRRIITRVGQESGPGMAERVRDHMAGEDANRRDWAELWGTRIGRALGLGLLIYLLYWLIGFAVHGG